MSYVIEKDGQEIRKAMLDTLAKTPPWPHRQWDMSARAEWLRRQGFDLTRPFNADRQATQVAYSQTVEEKQYAHAPTRLEYAAPVKPPHVIKHVYIAGPYTICDPVMNVRKAIEVADELVKLGFVPFVPHLSHLWHTISPQPWEYWMRQDLAWIEKCDALLRIPGDSKGADVEVAHAEAKGIPVFQTLTELVHHSKG